MDSGPVASGRQLPTEGASRNDELQSESCAHRSPDGAQRNPGPRLPQSKIPGLRCAPSWLQPLSPLSSDLPVGRFVDRAVESFFRIFRKIFLFPLTPNHIYNSCHPVPLRGRFAIVTDVGHGMRWTRQRFARDGIAGRVGERPVSGHQASRRGMLQRTAKSCGPDAPTLASSLRSLSRPNRA
jgi:hypothetical protein